MSDQARVGGVRPSVKPPVSEGVEIQRCVVLADNGRSIRFNRILAENDAVCVKNVVKDFSNIEDIQSAFQASIKDVKHFSEGDKFFLDPARPIKVLQYKDRETEFSKDVYKEGVLVGRKGDAATHVLVAVPKNSIHPDIDVQLKKMQEGANNFGVMELTFHKATSTGETGAPIGVANVKINKEERPEWNFPVGATSENDKNPQLAERPDDKNLQLAERPDDKNLQLALRPDDKNLQLAPRSKQPSAEPGLSSDAMKMPLLGSEALIEAPVEALGKAPAEAPIEESPIADTLRPQADTEKPLLVSDDPHVAAKIHRKSDNTKLLISMIIEAIVAASVLGAGLSQGGKIGDSADEDYGNADNADAQATQLQASEQSVIDTAGKDAYAAVTDALTAEAFADPANQKMATNPETPGVEPTGELRDDVTQQIATEAQAAQQTAEVKAQQAVETKVTQLQSYAEAQRTQADALNKEAKVVSGSTGGTGAGLVLAAIGSATKFTVNRRHNHQAKNNLMEINRSGEYDARYKGDGIPRTVDVKA